MKFTAKQQREILRVTAEWHADDNKLAEALENLLDSIPPRHSTGDEQEQWERAQDEAKATLAAWKKHKQISS